MQSKTSKLPSRTAVILDESVTEVFEPREIFEDGKLPETAPTRHVARTANMSMSCMMSSLILRLGGSKD